jgi:hypothetical protein
MTPDNIAAQLVRERLDASMHHEDGGPSPIPLRPPIEINPADPVLRAIRRADPHSDATDVAFLARADQLASQLDEIETASAPDALVRELLAAFGDPLELVAAVHHRYAVQRAGAPGANVTAERQAEVAALTVMENWADGIVIGWNRSSFAGSAELELAIDRRIESAVANGRLGELLEMTASATDETTVRVTARLLLARLPTLDRGSMAEAQAFIDFARGPDVQVALVLLAKAREQRQAAHNFVNALLAG